MVSDLHLLIRRLYRATADVPAADYQSWALAQLNTLVPFEAAVWGMGNAERGKFHNVRVIGLPQTFAGALEQTRDLNPLFALIPANPGQPFRMEDAIDDGLFYASDLYARCFEPYAVQRLLSTGQFDKRSGLYTLLSLYRFNRDQPFTDAERDIQAMASYHMVAAYSHAYFLHLSRPMPAQRKTVAAVVDAEGVLHEVEQGFLDLLVKHFPDWPGMRLPFELQQTQGAYREAGLRIEVSPLADLFHVRVHEQGPLDALTPRERQVVEGVCRGLSHKAIGRELGLAPTTVSSHLYRAYHKLGVESRTALSRLVHHLH